MMVVVACCNLVWFISISVSVVNLSQDNFFHFCDQFLHVHY